jgi:hypothetical protein
MRNIFVFGVLGMIAYWFDQRYNGGLYSRSIAEILQQIAVSFK